MSSSYWVSVPTLGTNQLCYVSITSIILFNPYDKLELEKCELAYMHFYMNTSAYLNREMHKDLSRKISLKSPLFNQTSIQVNLTSTCKEWIWTLTSQYIQKINSKSITDLSIRAKLLKS